MTYERWSREFLCAPPFLLDPVGCARQEACAPPGFCDCDPRAKEPARDDAEGRRPRTRSDRACREYLKTKSRCVGSLGGRAVYFVGSRVGFHLAIESPSGEFRRLTEAEHLRFKRQSRLKGVHYLD